MTLRRFVADPVVAGLAAAVSSSSSRALAHRLTRSRLERGFRSTLHARTDELGVIERAALSTVRLREDWLVLAHAKRG